MAQNSKTPDTYSIYSFGTDPKQFMTSLTFVNIDGNIIVFKTQDGGKEINVKFNQFAVASAPNTPTFFLQDQAVRIAKSSRYVDIDHFIAINNSVSGGALPYGNLEFDSFPYCLDIIEIPTNALIYRVGNTSASQTENPRFFGSYNIAALYKTGNKTMFAHSAAKGPLKLLDIRFMKYWMLSLLLDLREKFIDNENYQNKGPPYYYPDAPFPTNDYVNYNKVYLNPQPIPNKDVLTKCIYALQVAFGLGSIETQSRLLSTIFNKRKSGHNKPHPFDNCGDRCSYHNIDDYVALLFKANFGRDYHGYIAPVIKTVMLDGGDPKVLVKHFHNEICIFSPKTALCNRNISSPSKLNMISVSDLIRRRKEIGAYKTGIYMNTYSGGAPTNLNLQPIVRTIENDNVFYCTTNPNIKPESYKTPQVFVFDKNTCNNIPMDNIQFATGNLYVMDIKIMRFVAMELLLHIYEDNSLDALGICEYDVECLFTMMGLFHFEKQIVSYNRLMNANIQPSPQLLKALIAPQFGFRLKQVGDPEKRAYKVLAKLFGSNILKGFISYKFFDRIITNQEVVDYLCIFSPKRSAISRSLNLRGGSHPWRALENFIENPPDQNSLQCWISNQPRLKLFVSNILAKLMVQLYDAMHITHSNHTDHKIIEKLLATLVPSLSDDRKYLLKPGIRIVEAEKKDIHNKCITHLTARDIQNIKSLLNESFSMSEIMGAIYGISTNAGMIGVLLKASLPIGNSYDTTYPNIRKLLCKTIKTLRRFFDLPESFNAQKLLSLLDSDNKRIDQGELRIAKTETDSLLLDMLIYTPYYHIYSLQRQNLNNMQYIRSRTQKGNKDVYRNISELPSCPVFDSKHRNDKAIKMVDGNEWYTIPINNTFHNIMKEYKRTAKAGPSGSTLMLMNLIFEIIGIESTKQNYTYLLLCIISDFVPKYHSLTEVIMIFAKEAKYAQTYSLDKSPVKWLCDYLEISTPEKLIDQLERKLNPKKNK